MMADLRTVRRILAAALIPAAATTILCAGESRLAANVQDLRRALADARAGDTIALAGGVWDFHGTLTATVKGADGEPVVLKPARRGETVFEGKSGFVLENAAHVVVEGFEFRSTNGPAIELRGCSNVRVTRNIFHLRETRRGNWVLITGSERHPAALSQHNRIDHNLFENKRELGNFITVEGARNGAAQVSQHDTIDRNHFRDIGPRAENALEAIRIGSADLSLSSGYTLIERNLFERCDGDPEYISIKSSDNTIRNNTFRECLGTLSLRHGNRNTVEGNFILGNGRSGGFTDSTGKTWTLGTGGVRFCGDKMMIINNYFEGLTGTGWDATLAVTAGDADYGDGQPLNRHFRIRDAVIAFNTFIDNAGSMEIGYDGGGFQGNRWHLTPTGLTIANNLMVGKRDTLIRIHMPPGSSHWEGNIAFASHHAVVARSRIEGVRELDPRLSRTGDLWRPSETSPVVDAATGSFPSVVSDVDGQLRVGDKDVGADEVSTLRAGNRPLSGADVGPAAP